MSNSDISICAEYRIICSSSECLMRVYENGSKWFAETECDSGRGTKQPFEGESLTEAYWKGMTWIEENLGEFTDVIVTKAYAAECKSD